MPFKSDLEAAQARAEATEQENKILRKRVAELENPAPLPKPILPQPASIYETTSIGKVIEKTKDEKMNKEDWVGVFYLACAIICGGVWLFSLTMFFLSGRWIFAAVMPVPLILSIVNAKKCAEIAHKSK